MNEIFKQKGITLDEMEKLMNEFFNEKNKDPNIKPDIIIYEDSSIFTATIKSGGMTLMTGIGGLVNLAKSYGAFNWTKVEYNSTILDAKQKEELCKRLVEYDTQNTNKNKNL